MTLLEGKGAYYYIHGKKGRTLASINISQDLVNDSTFPFHHRDKLHIKINPKDKSLTITKEES